MSNCHPPLVVFDVDGTLVQSIEWDDELFSFAIGNELGVRDISTNWASYRYQTDSGLVLEMAPKGSREGGVIAKVRNRFVTALRKKASTTQCGLAEVPGACRLLDTLHRSEPYRVAIATGGWSTSAHLKLQLAGVDISRFPLASADDYVSRENIILHAIDLSRTAYQIPSFSQVTYVGDGTWDVAAARNLNIDFIGVGEKLRSRVATSVLDFSSPHHFKELLDASPDSATRQIAIRLVERPDDIETCRRLFRDYADSLPIDLDFQNFENELADLPGDYSLPTGRMFLAYEGTEVAGCGAYRDLEGGCCEMKRLWVAPGFRKRGIGRLLAEHLIDEATRFGYDTMRLDTLRSLEAATSLYLSLDFREIPAYRHNPCADAVFMQLSLDRANAKKHEGNQ